MEQQKKQPKKKGTKVNKPKGDGNNELPKKKSQPKPIPSFKTIPNTNFLVDAFQFKNDSCKHYFLTHFHADHYVGISKGWHHGTIYCTAITSRLLQHKLGVNGEYISVLPLEQEVEIENARVCLLDANHCPGAALILFKVGGTTILHTGDFRYDPKMKLYQQLHNTKVDVLYLDNTFCDPKYTFPTQSQIIQGIVDIVFEEISSGALVLIGTYVIGKEKVLIEVAKRCNVKIFVTPEKLEILRCLDVDMSIFTVYPSDTPVHAVSMGLINYKKMWDLWERHKAGFTKLVGIVPTGWGQARAPISRRDSGPVSTITAAYSEHSSYTELLECVSWLRPSKIVPTVDCNTPEKVKSILSHFQDRVDNSRNYNTLIPYLASTPTSQRTSTATYSDSPSDSLDIDAEFLEELFYEPFSNKRDSEPEADSIDRVDSSGLSVSGDSAGNYKTEEYSNFAIKRRSSDFHDEFSNDRVGDFMDDLSAGGEITIKRSSSLSVATSLPVKKEKKSGSYFNNPHQVNIARQTMVEKDITVDYFEMNNGLDVENPDLAFISQQKWIEKCIQTEASKQKDTESTKCRTPAKVTGPKEQNACKPTKALSRPSPSANPNPKPGTPNSKTHSTTIKTPPSKKLKTDEKSTPLRQSSITKFFSNFFGQ